MDQLVGVIDWLGVPAAFTAWGFALYVHLVAPGTPAARLLVAMLVVDGIAVISSHNNWSYADSLLGFGLDVWWRIHLASDWAVMAIYLAFIGVTVPSPLARPFGTAKARWILAACAALLTAAAMPLDLDTFVMQYAKYLYTLVAAVLTWGFAAAVHAWITARDTATRARARAFAVAFGIRDTVWMITFLALVAFLNGNIDAGSPIVTQWTPTLYVGAVLVYVPLVAYGMLRTQLFDIDLRVKRTLRRSTVLAAFVAVFFLISGLAEIFLSKMLGNVLGLFATAVLVMFLEPLQQAAQSLANAAMPHTQDTPEYEAFRKLQVYEATMHASLENGAIPAQRRATLDELVRSLGIDPAMAQRLEQDALARG